MKRFLASLLLALLALPALAQLIEPSQLQPHWGFVRKGHCANGGGEGCGTNPPTWHLTAAECGTLQSTSNARNVDGSASTAGVRYTLPTVAELTTAGYASGGLTDLTNRAGQCELHFVMGSPGPGNYLRIGLDSGVSGTDKVTFIAGGASHDLFSGDVTFPYSTPGVLTIVWNGTSWLARAAAPAIAQWMHLGQFFMNGQGRAFMVTADPSWWTVPTKVGSVAYCPLNGRGVTMETNGATELGVTPYNCLFHTAAAGTLTEWLVVRYTGSYVVSAISAGAAYGAGTAPNGRAYAAGNYAIISVTASTALEDGDTMDLHNLPTTNGTVLNGRWIVKKISATDFELHESVEDFGGNIYTASVGPPSAFVAGDTLTVSNPVGGSSFVLNATSGGTDRTTNVISGAEFNQSAQHETIVGLVRRVGGVYTDAAANRLVSSWFNPFEITATASYSATRTTSSTVTFVEPNTESRTNFVNLNRASKYAVVLGDRGEGVRWQLTATVSNNTNGDGCELSVGFDGTTAEAATGKFMNPAGTNGASYSISISGIKTGLTETNHFVTILARAITGGTCSIDSVGTLLTLYLRQ